MTQDHDTPDNPKRKRPAPGERRLQILQTLAQMLQEPGADRVTTAALASKLQVSEAALYRHFASKAQMFEGLIDFIEESAFGLVRQITERENSGLVQAARITAAMAQFAEKNPGMARVMVGDALVYENERLQQRMNAFFDKLEASLRQSLKEAVAQGASNLAQDVGLRANLLCSFLMGRLQRYARSGFKQNPSENLDAALAVILS